MAFASHLAIVVDDTDATDPVRIDPTFSDEDWIRMGRVPGADDSVNPAVVDSPGNLYVGGSFIIVGEAIANCVAKWNGTQWSPLGSGMTDWISALAVSGADLYAGGEFTTAGAHSRCRQLSGNDPE
ncbi:MAG TPA: hypothetical protein PLU30_02775 [Verrucomicrobiae bacterium]|mgnify:CR=1 FL=1|nr:hypothetical protein [Verrucomicrobiae bacterium]